MPFYSTMDSQTDGAYDADNERRASTDSEQLMEANFRDMVQHAAREYGTPLSEEELAALPRLAPIVRAAQSADVMFVENDDGVIEARYPDRSCTEDAFSTSATDGDDEDDQPPAYASVGTRYALVSHDIVQDDLRPTDQHGVVARYIPPALRDVKNAPAIVAKDPLTMHERLNALDHAIRNPMRTTNLIERLSNDARVVLDAVLGYLNPRPNDKYRASAIAAIYCARPRWCGIDYDVKFCNGIEARIRDIDAWRAPNGRAILARFWSNPKRTIALSMIQKLLDTPQYSAEDGFFLQHIKANVARGIARFPKEGAVVF